MRSVISLAAAVLAIGTFSCGSSDSGSNDQGDGSASDSGVGGDVAPIDAKSETPTGCATDVLAPFEGGASYYAKWSHGPPSTSDFFPISVWLQSASNASK